jgi:hypothetical protein
MSELEFFDALAMLKLEEEYPKKVARIDELTDKEKAEQITEAEQKELDTLDVQLKREFDRCKLHYRMNWSFMAPRIKEGYRNQVKEYRKKVEKRKAA